MAAWSSSLSEPATSALVQRVQSSWSMFLGGEAFLTKCPNCRLKIYRCLLDKTPEEEKKTYVLYCSVCEHKFNAQEKISLTSGGRKYCTKQELKKLDQLGVCDFIQYETHNRGHVTTHYAVCTARYAADKKIELVRLSLIEDGCQIVKKTVTMDKIVQHRAFVYRFMPFDCRSREETLRLAEEVCKKENCEEWLDSEVCENATGEQFANWLKTGVPSDLIRRVLGIINKCPNCKKGLDRSCRLSDQKPIQLVCTVCGEQYEVQDLPNQEKNIKRNPRKKRYRAEKLSSIDQLGPADIFKRRVDMADGNLPFYHHLICTGIDRAKDLIHVIDLVADEAGKVVIRQHSVRLEDIKEAKPKVFRYLPLDCLPRDATLLRAEEFAEGRQKWEPEDYSLKSSNCQDFASECKTGERFSEDREKVLRAGLGGIMISADLSYVASTRNN